MAHEIGFELQQFPLPPTQVLPAKPDQTYPIYSGRTIEQQFSISGLNKLPITILEDRACLDTETSDEPPIPVEVTCNWQLVDGSLLGTLQGENWGLEPNLIHVEEELALQEVFVPDPLNKRTEILIREYALNENGQNVTITLWQNFNTENPEIVKQPDNPFTKPASEVIFFPNGRGILYPIQWTYKRLEEIRWAIRQETSDFALSNIIVGMVTKDPESIIAQLMKSRLAIVAGKNIQTLKIGDTRVVDQLNVEYAQLEMEYFRGCHIIDTGKQVDRPVAADTRIKLEPQTNFIESVRTKIQEFYSMFPNPITVTFKKLTTMSPADKQMELQNIITARDTRLIKPKEAIEIAKLLF